MKQYLRAAAAGAIFGLAAMLVPALAVTLLGRDTANYRNIGQVGIAATSTDNNVTATPSGTIATAYQVTQGFTYVGTVATIGDAIKLPSTLTFFSPTNIDASMTVYITNHTANSMNVFPFSASEGISNAGTALANGAALAVAAHNSVQCTSSSAAARWFCIIG